MQPKYMGSRCNIYLNRDVNRCYAVSRNGYKIKQIELLALYEELLLRFEEFMIERHMEWMILDGELLPWRALGEGLIERQFLPIEKALDVELCFRVNRGLRQLLLVCSIRTLGVTLSVINFI